MYKFQGLLGRILSLSLVAVFLFVSGCASSMTAWGPEASPFGDGRVTASSTNQMFKADIESFNDEQLISLLNQGGNSTCQTSTSQSSSSGGTSSTSEIDLANRLNSAFKNANSCNCECKINDNSSSCNISCNSTVCNNDNNSICKDAIAKRSQIQDRLIMASDQRCNLYKTYLKQIDIGVNESLGIVSTLLSTAGSIVTGPLSKVFIGGGTASTDIKNQVIQAIFSTFTTSVVIPCIDKTRTELRQSMMDNRTQPISMYTVEGAIADVIRYHGACSLDTGIACAQKSVSNTKSSSDLGIQTIKDTLSPLGITLTGTLTPTPTPKPTPTPTPKPTPTPAPQPTQNPSAGAPK